MNNSESLNTLANILQVASFILITNEASNDKLMDELQHQNKAYLETIIKQNAEIIERIKKNV